MSKKYYRFFTISSLFILFLTSCASRPALPLKDQDKDLDGFSEYVSAAEKSLNESKSEVKKSEDCLAESKRILEEVRAIHQSMIKISSEQDAKLKRIRSERAVWENRKKAEEQKKIEEELRIKKEAEATPPPLPYSPSDAPIQKK